MNRHELLSIGVGTLLILGIVGGAGFSSAVASPENPLDVGLQDDEEEEEEEEDEEDEDEEEEINVSQVEVSAQQAIEIAENETNGTVVGLELVTEAVNETADDNETTDETETLVWEVELVQNGTEHEVLIDATDGTVLEVETEDAEQEDADEAENDAEETEQETETTTEG